MEAPSESVLVLCVVVAVFRVSMKRNIAHLFFDGLHYAEPPTEEAVAKIQPPEHARRAARADAEAPDALARLQSLDVREAVITPGSLFDEPHFDSLDTVCVAAFIALLGLAAATVYRCVLPTAAASVWLLLLLVWSGATATVSTARLAWMAGPRASWEARLSLIAGAAGFFLSFAAVHVPAGWLDFDVHASFEVLHGRLAALMLTLGGPPKPGPGAAGSGSVGGGGGNGGEPWQNDIDVLGLSLRSFAGLCHLLLALAAAGAAAAVPAAALRFGQTAGEQLRDGVLPASRWLRALLWTDVFLPWLLVLLWVPSVALLPLSPWLATATAAAQGAGGAADVAASAKVAAAAPAALAGLRTVRAALAAAALSLRLYLARSHFQTFLNMVLLGALRSELAAPRVDAARLRSFFSLRRQSLPMVAAQYMAPIVFAGAALAVTLYGGAGAIWACDLGRRALGLASCGEASAATAAAAPAAAAAGNAAAAGGGGPADASAAIAAAAAAAAAARNGSLRTVLDAPSRAGFRQLAADLDLSRLFIGPEPASGVASFLLWWALLWWASGYTFAVFKYRRRSLAAGAAGPAVRRYQSGVDRTTKKERPAAKAKAA
ncbi:unnamed protein product [Phaeothamnion confervicola]